MTLTSVAIHVDSHFATLGAERIDPKRLCSSEAVARAARPRPEGPGTRSEQERGVQSSERERETSSPRR